ncbi:hypothetical protein [Thalassomonas sp. RHCl1]|uniref:hypothetical protein n=1 Tax=Thalassomonas sp. RHCl1 TaxID=2995320 RepID=UPI00248C137E|nr:hypothetical protein [Thalassomonas sp. RHCl1]
MAKHNDMPELNSAKVFSTNLFIKEYLKLPYPPPLTTTAAFAGDSDLVNIAVYGFNRNSYWLKDEPIDFAKNVHKRPS